jgi:L-alanine-DL-glutamate epimerase-like enolase superfamily enzyme
VRDLAAAFGLPITVEDSGGGDVVTAAAMHLNCSLPPKLVLSGYLPSEMVVERFATGTPRAANGRARLPSGPGLGVDVDEAALGGAALRFE